MICDLGIMGERMQKFPDMYMKHSVYTWVTIAALALAVAGCERKSEWSVDYDGTMKEVAAQDGLALVLVDGPGWNAPSVQLSRNLLKSQEFREFVRENRIRLIEVAIPDPRGRGVSPKRAEELDKVVLRYDVHGLPHLALSDSAGFSYAVVNETNAREGMRVLREGMEFRRAFETKLTAAKAAQGDERVGLLMQAREMLPENWRTKYPGLDDAIIESDPEDKTGLKGMRDRRQLFRDQLEELNKEADKRMGDLKGVPQPEALQRLSTALIQLSREKTWLPEVQYRIFKTIAICFLSEKRIGEAQIWLQKAVDADPESPDAENLRKEIVRLQKGEEEKKKSSDEPVSQPTEK